MFYQTFKQLLPYALLAIAGIYGVELLATVGMQDYREAFTALIIALLMQPWIIYQLEN